MTKCKVMGCDKPKVPKHLTNLGYEEFEKYCRKHYSAFYYQAVGDDLGWYK